MWMGEIAYEKWEYRNFGKIKKSPEKELPDKVGLHDCTDIYDDEFLEEETILIFWIFLLREVKPPVECDWKC